MNKIRIAYIVHNLARGGIARHVLDIMTKLDRKNFHPIIFCLDKRGVSVEPIESMHIPVKDLQLGRSSIYRFNTLKATFTLSKFLKSEKVHIVQTFQIKSTILGTLASIIAKTPTLITTRHDMAWDTKSRQILMLKISNCFADKVIAVSDAVRKNTIVMEGIQIDKIQTIYNGVDIDKFDVKPDKETKRKIGLDPGFVVGMVANFMPVKDHINFCHAAATVLDSFEKVQFLLVGSGPLEEEIRALTKKLGIEKKVVFAGHREDIPELLSSMDIFVLSSKSEGHPYSLIEALAQGKPVVATRVGGVSDVVVNGKNGYLVPPKNSHQLAQAIIKLLKDTDLRRSFGKEGKRVARQNFSLKRMVSETELLYRKLVAQNYL